MEHMFKDQVIMKENQIEQQQLTSYFLWLVIIK